MPYIQTTALQKLLKLRKRTRGIAGGSSASKTISILQILIDKAQSDITPKLASVTSESMPHLKRGAIRDFISIMELHNYFRQDRWNKTDYIYTFETGSKIEFFSLDMPHKVRGPRRDRLFINEANNNSKETYDQLEIRTNEEIWLDWNPTNEFWFYTDLKDQPNVDFLILTYKDNEGLPQSIVDSIESRKGNKNWWKVYGLGELGEVESRIYTGWKIIDDIPFEARIERHGLDFGYSNDPTALVGIYYYNGGYILDEEVYQKGLSNKQIANVIINLPTALVIADSAEPKSIDEIKLYGVNILPTVKGKDSVAQGIQYVQQQRISVTKRSVNLIKEYRNYLWETDKDGKIINVPIGVWNHQMDACLTGDTLIKTNKGSKYIKDIKGGDKVLTRKGYKEVIFSSKTRENTIVYKLITSDGNYLVGTSDHKIFTKNRGFVALTALRYGDKVDVWNQRESNFTGELILGILKVSHDFVGTQVQTILRKFARIVKRFSQLINMKINSFVPIHVQTIVKLPDKADTYDLMVKDQQEFYANNILVHNCRYGFDGLRGRQIDYIPSKNAVENQNWGLE